MYGISLMVTAEESLTKYLADVLAQMSGEDINAMMAPYLPCMPASSRHANGIESCGAGSSMQPRVVHATHADWLLAGQLQKMVMVVTSCTTKEVQERWTFDILTNAAAIAAT